MNDIKYRGDIDGLRALAVLSVVLFHLNLNWIKSGFLGVDIFFVISGYLITLTIIRDLNNNLFSIKNFYLKRLRRILPALITVLIFSSFFAWLILLPQDLENYSKSLISAIMSIANLFFFINLDFGYFGANSQIIPLLHTWSLGVEEQFYILWPLILMVVFNSHYYSKKKLLVASLLLLLISSLFFLSGKIDVYVINSPRWYYSPTHRAFELLFGCCLAISINKNMKIINKQLLNILSILALLSILIPIFFIDVRFPSFWTIIACIGATLFIYTGSSKEFTPIGNKILSIKPFVAIGLISYSLYLWHWPIIAYIDYLNIDKTSSVCTIIFIVSILLSALSYFFVEKPFRYKFKFSFSKSFVLLWVIPLIAAIFFYTASRNYSFGFNQQPSNLDLNFFGGDILETDGCNTSQYYNKDQINGKCFIGDTHKNNTNILVLGDSHAMAYQGMISTWLNNLKLKGYIYTKSLTGNPKFYKYIMYNKSFYKNSSFYIKKLKPKAVILAGSWSYKTYYDMDSFKVIDKSIGKFIKEGITPIILYDVYGGPKAACGFSRLDKIMNKTCFSKKDSRNNFIKQLKKKYGKKLIAINPNLIIQDISSENNFYVSYNHTPLYTDKEHLNYNGSTIIGNLYLKKYGNPLASKVNTN